MGDSTDNSSPSGEKEATSGLSLIKARLGFSSEKGSIRKDLLKALSDTDEDNQEFSKQERLMLRNTLRFGSTRIEDVMIPRADIIAIDVDSPMAELMALFEEEGHSRIPVYRGTLDDIVGIIHIKDFLNWLTRKAQDNSKDVEGAAKGGFHLDLTQVNLRVSIEKAKITREVPYIPASLVAVDLLLRMQATRNHMALVVDEYGGTDGLVTIEDLVEEIVGEIEDEHDDEEKDLIEHHDYGLVASARAPIEELESVLDLSLALADNEEEPHTLGGLVFILSGRVPVRGEIISHPEGVEFEVLEADSRKIKKLKVTVKERRSEGQEEV